MGKLQREISVSEFFTKNRHLLGFDNPRKALLTAVKEAVDNSLDACEDAGILPEVTVEVTQLSEDRFAVMVMDNGPGIVPKQVPNVFGRLLYGSKFHARRMSRGQQGIGISAAVLYAQLTTGKPVTIVSKPGAKKPATRILLRIDTQKNAPHVAEETTVEVRWTGGVRIEMEIEAKFQRGRNSVEAFLVETAIANPHATLHWKAPDAERRTYARTTDDLPPQPEEAKPHPRGVELGLLERMLRATRSRNLAGFLKAEFSRVSSRVAAELCQVAGVRPEQKPRTMPHDLIEKVYRAMNDERVKIMAPPSNSVTPIGETLLERSLHAQVPADFFCAVSRSPSVYRGNPFIVEVGMAYGGQLSAEETVNLYRYANRVPLLYQQGACAITEAVTSVDWKPYGLQQSRGGLPAGPAVLFVHLASVWVPFTSESKEAVASYPEILKELRLGLQECGRRLQGFVNKRARIAYEANRRSVFERYIPEVAAALQALCGAPPKKVVAQLTKLSEKITAKADHQASDTAVHAGARKALAANRADAAAEGNGGGA